MLTYLLAARPPTKSPVQRQATWLVINIDSYFHCLLYLHVFRALNRMPSIEELEPLTKKAINEAEIADQITRDALERSSTIIMKLPEELKKAKQLPKDVEASNKAITQSNNQSK